MTIFGRDSSHHTVSISDANLKSLNFHTCKLTDGSHYYEDPTYKSQTDRARNIGVPVLGSYHVLWGNKSLSDQATWWVQRARALTPYCDTMPYIWQPDCESFGYNGLPTIDQINSFGDMVCSRAGVPAERFIPYAPAWVYGSGLVHLKYRNYWGSNYGKNPSGPYQAVYPGDLSSRWSTYIPMTILQYGSNTDIGDANAFRGTLAQFLNTIKAGSSIVPPQEEDMGPWLFRLDEHEPPDPDHTAGDDPLHPGAGWITNGVWMRPIPTGEGYQGWLSILHLTDAQVTRIPRGTLHEWGVDATKAIGVAGPAGPPGPEGPPGDPGFVIGDTVHLTGTITEIGPVSS